MLQTERWRDTFACCIETAAKIKSLSSFILIFFFHLDAQAKCEIQQVKIVMM